MTRNRASKLHDLLGARTALDGDDDRGFEEQMQDLGVEVVKPKIEWYQAKIHKSPAGLKGKISFAKTCITLGKEAVNEMISSPEEELRVEFGIFEKNDKKFIALRKSRDGFKPCKTRSGSCRITSQEVIGWLERKGVPRGVYKLKAVEGGWLAVPEGKR